VTLGADAEAALRELESIRVEDAVPGGPLSFAVFDGAAFDWEAWREEISDAMRKLLSVSGSGPVRTPYAVTFAGWEPRFETVWLGDPGPDAATAHWSAVDAQLSRRLRTLRAITSAVRIAQQIAVIASGGWNPVGAVQAARKLPGAIRAFVDALGE
jgi:hypothetical protein